MIKLSKRLQAIAELVPPGSRIADIGTDHAFLPCYLVKRGIVPYAIGVEVREGPYGAARRTVSAYYLEDKIDIRFGDGLKPLQPGEVEIVILAGMGGNTMLEILEAFPQLVSSLQALILQPMNGPEHIRAWLAGRGWTIAAEELLQEDGRFYQIIKAVQGKGYELTRMELLYGPLLIASRHPLLPELIEKDIQALQDIKAQLAKSQSDMALERLQELEQRVQEMKELKECLSAAKE